jgi:hypothetical protein
MDASCCADDIQVITPFILALQYFGAERDIFSFDRNPKTFSFTICILFCALPILTYALSLLNNSWDHFVPKLYPKRWDGEGSVIV